MELQPLMLNVTMEVIATTGLGIQMNLHEKSDPLTDAIKRYFHTTDLKVLMSSILPNWLKTMTGFTMFDKEGLLSASDLIKAVIEEKRRNDQKYNDFTAAFMNSKIEEKGTTRSPTDDEIVASVLGLFLAGIDTQAVLLSITIFLLAQHPEIQERLLREIRKCTSQGLDFDSLKDMVFMDAVMNECLRLYPPGTSTERKVSKDYDLNGVTLPAELDVYVSLYIMHHDEKYFPDAEKFDPDRFMPDRVAEIEVFSFIPFGQGPRNCPGMRFALIGSKLVLSRLMLAYEFLPSESHPATIDVSETVDELLITSQLFIKLKARN